VPPQSLAVVSVSPLEGKPGATMVVTVNGKGFDSATRCLFANKTSTAGQLTVNGVSFLSSNVLFVTLDLSKAKAGPYDVTVTKGTISQTLKNAFTVKP
jgi:hypothetical protein